MGRGAFRDERVSVAAAGLPARLSGQGGASFVIALMFVLLVGFVATLTLSSASVNAERATAANRADDQGYYAVVSALDAGVDLVERDLCATGADAFSVTVGTDKKATAAIGADPLGLQAWARDQVAAIANGGKAQPKHVVVKASGMGRADVPDVLVTFTVNDGGVYVRSCIDVWGDGEVPADDAVVKADLVEHADYANYLTKQAASGSSLSGALPLTVTWVSMEAESPSDGEGGA